MLIVYVLRMKITQFDDLQQVFIEQSDLMTNSTTKIPIIIPIIIIPPKLAPSQ